MNKKLPFEKALEDRMNSMPVFNEAKSWEAMNRLLDKHDKRKPVFVWWRYFALLLLLVLLLFGTWKLLYKNDGIKQVKENKMPLASVEKNNLQIANAPVDSNDIKQGPISLIDSNHTEKQRDKAAEYSKQDEKQKLKSLAGNNAPASENAVKNNNDKVKEEQREKNNTTNYNFYFQKSAKKKNKPSLNNNDNNPFIAGTENKYTKKRIRLRSVGKHQSNLFNPGPDNDVENIQLNNKDDQKKPEQPVVKNRDQQAHSNKENKTAWFGLPVPGTNAPELFTLPKGEIIVKKDSSENDKTLSKLMSTVAQPVKTGTLPPAKPGDNTDTLAITKIKTTEKIEPGKEKKSNSFVWSAGIGMQQQVPVGKQQLTSYGFNGKNNFINNYIPSVYLQLEKPSKWFLQAVLGFASPQPTEQINYSRKTTLDNNSGKLSTSLVQLKKLYYHRLLLDFNYYIRPGLSIGAGFGNNWLFKAISEEQFIVKNVQRGNEEITKRIIHRGYTDSFFYSSVPVYLVQLNYRWRKWDFGIRYTADILPFMKYTKPTGEIEQPKNYSLDILLKFRLWRSRK